jgi:hypothetical protein
MKLRPTAILLVTLLASAVCQTSSHDEWVKRSLVNIESIKAGMTRAQLEMVFDKEGGLSTPTHRTYVYRDCRYFKVDVVFEPADGLISESPGDRIKTISRPYLGWPILD